MQKAMHRKLRIKGKIQKNTAPTQKYITTEKSSHNGIKLGGSKSLNSLGYHTRLNMHCFYIFSFWP